MTRQRKAHRALGNSSVDTYEVSEGNSINDQQQRLLAALRAAGSAGVSTIEAREIYDVMAPAARTFELRHQYGFNIQCVWTHGVNAQGRPHRTGRYVLHPGSWRAAND
jgi:hypothetical protein